MLGVPGSAFPLGRAKRPDRLLEQCEVAVLVAGRRQDGDRRFDGVQCRRLRESLVQAIPLGRMGTPHDIADAVAYLAPDEAAYITGQTLSVSGGLTMS